MTETASKPQPGGLRGTLRSDLLAAVAVVAFALLLGASDGFSRLWDAQGDNDSLLRLVEVRDLLAGQGWFDPFQYRMGPEGGFAMHWSRLVDAPIAAIVRAAGWAAGSRELGEEVARVLWPSLLLGVGTFLLVRAARVSYGPEAAFPATVVGALALVSIGVFQPGAIDHHNVQLVLTLGMGLGLLSASFGAGVLAGACAALTLAIGMETLPYVAVGGAIAAGLFLVRGEHERGTAAGFGLGFAAVAAAAFVATIPPSRWGQPACDAYSVAQASVAVLAGLGLAAIAALGKSADTIGRRLVALGLLGAAVALLLILAFPHCLSDPYAGLDPRLRRLWLDGVTEAQPVFEIAAKDPAMLMTWYATPLLGLLVLAVPVLRDGLRRADAIVGALLLAAFLVSVWQVRGAVFAVALATVPLSGWIARRRAAAAHSPSRGGTLALAAAWILSFNAVWSAAGDRLFAPSLPPDAGTDSAGACYRSHDYAALTALPAATVLSVSNLGSAILAWTPHRALAGSYHRNVEGNLAALDMLMAATAEAELRIRANRVGIVAVCPGNSETRLLAEAAPDGLLAALARGDVPSWLEPIGGGPALRLYRVRPD
ncbi:MAG: GtrA family protein [Mesorhizobium sp.]|nr:GtrA family protein [Mesorhizobium sp.]